MWWHDRDEKRAKLKRTVYDKQNGICPYCGKPMIYEKVSLDRVIPGSKGGTYTLNNVVVAHVHCNLYKSSKLGKKYVKRIVDLGWLDKEKILNTYYQIRQGNI